jgi:hypothetical protein
MKALDHRTRTVINMIISYVTEMNFNWLLKECEWRFMAVVITDY